MCLCVECVCVCVCACALTCEVQVIVFRKIGYIYSNYDHSQVMSLSSSSPDRSTLDYLPLSLWCSSYPELTVSQILACHTIATVHVINRHVAHCLDVAIIYSWNTRYPSSCTHGCSCSTIASSSSWSLQWLLLQG